MDGCTRHDLKHCEYRRRKIPEIFFVAFPVEMHSNDGIDAGERERERRQKKQDRRQKRREESVVGRLGKKVSAGGIVGCMDKKEQDVGCRKEGERA